MTGEGQQHGQQHRRDVGQEQRVAAAAATGASTKASNPAKASGTSSSCPTVEAGYDDGGPVDGQAARSDRPAASGRPTRFRQTSARECFRAWQLPAGHGKGVLMTKILLVEDHEELWDFLSQSAASARLRGRALAHDGQQALDQVAAETPDLVLLDMNLPVIDGWTVARTLRAQRESRAGDRADRARHGVGPGACDGGRVRRLPCQAGRVRQAAGPDRRKPASRGRGRVSWGRMQDGIRVAGKRTVV